MWKQKVSDIACKLILPMEATLKRQEDSQTVSTHSGDPPDHAMRLRHQSVKLNHGTKESVQGDCSKCKPSTTSIDPGPPFQVWMIDSSWTIGGPDYFRGIGKPKCCLDRPGSIAKGSQKVLHEIAKE